MKKTAIGARSNSEDFTTPRSVRSDLPEIAEGGDGREVDVTMQKETLPMRLRAALSRARQSASSHFSIYISYTGCRDGAILTSDLRPALRVYVCVCITYVRYGESTRIGMIQTCRSSDANIINSGRVVRSRRRY